MSLYALDITRKLLHVLEMSLKLPPGCPEKCKSILDISGMSLNQKSCGNYVITKC